MKKVKVHYSQNELVHILTKSFRFTYSLCYNLKILKDLSLRIFIVMQTEVGRELSIIAIITILNLLYLRRMLLRFLLYTLPHTTPRASASWVPHSLILFVLSKYFDISFK